MQKTLLFSLLMLTVITTGNAMDTIDGLEKSSHPDFALRVGEAAHNGWTWLVEQANTLKEQLPKLEQNTTQVPSATSESQQAAAEPTQPAPAEVSTRSIKPVQPVSEQPAQPNLDPNYVKLPFINTTISKTTAVAGGVAVIALAGITYVLHKKGILKKAKQKLCQCPYALATVTAGLAAAGAGSYYYFAH